MNNNTEKDGIRKRKTKQLLNNAMLSLLERTSFERITVRDICEEAHISRATFYAYHLDKYSFLQDWLMDLIPGTPENGAPFEVVAAATNNFVYKHRTIIKNILYGASEETYKILHGAILSTINLVECEDSKNDPQYVVLSNIYAGGVVEYALWLIRNKFPENIAPMNIFLYNISKAFREWSIREN